MLLIRLIFLIFTSALLFACSNTNSDIHLDNTENSATTDSCDIAKKFENAKIVEGMMSENYTGELNNYFGDDTTKLDFKHVFENGRLVKSYFYYESGNIQEEYSFKCEALNGLQKWYYEDGTLAKVIPYSYGYRQGVGKIFDNEGYLRQQVNFSKDSIVGDIVNYDEFGNLTYGDSLINQ